MFFGVDVPRSSDITVKIRFVTGRGQPFIAWQGLGDANEADVLETICQAPLVTAYIRKAAQNKRIKADEDGAFRIPVKISWYALQQRIDERDSVMMVYPLWSGGADDGRQDQVMALDVIRTLVESLNDRHQHVGQMLDSVQKIHDSYEKAVAALSQHSLLAMDKVSGHAASAFSAAAAPFADVSKSLVKAVDDSRVTAATSAKESQDLLIEALKNRIVESSQVTKQSVAQDIKEVMQLWPLFKGFLGEAESKPPA